MLSSADPALVAVFAEWHPPKEGHWPGSFCCQRQLQLDAATDTRPYCGGQLRVNPHPGAAAPQWHHCAGQRGPPPPGAPSRLERESIGTMWTWMLPHSSLLAGANVS